MPVVGTIAIDDDDHKTQNSLLRRLSDVINNLRDSAQANTTLSINSSTGNDATGIPAYKTWQGVIDHVANDLDGNGFDLTILGDGTTFTTGFNLNKPFVGWVNVIIDGNGSTIHTTSAHAIAINAALPSNSTTIKGFTLTTTTSGSCIATGPAATGVLFIGTGMTFGASARAHFNMGSPGLTIWPTQNYTVSGGAFWHVNVFEGGFFNGGETNLTATLSGTPAFSQFFVYVESGTIDIAAIAWSGSATGTRFGVFHGDLKTDTGGAPHIIPGNGDGWVVNGFYG